MGILATDGGLEWWRVGVLRGLWCSLRTCRRILSLIGPSYGVIDGLMENVLDPKSHVIIDSFFFLYFFSQPRREFVKSVSWKFKIFNRMGQLGIFFNSVAYLHFFKNFLLGYCTKYDNLDGVKYCKESGSAMSYWLCKAPAVGASGAIFGLVGSYAMFILRHRNLTNDDGMGDLQHIARVIVLNMVIGLMAKGIDNWGHLGGLIGGVAASWLLGPAWKYEYPFNDRRGAFVDKAPIFSLIKTQRKP